MKTSNPFYLSVISLLLMLTVSIPGHARLKCWTNNEGVKECGDKVPPEYAQKGHQELSKQGLVVKEAERAKTKEELAEHKRMKAIKAAEVEKQKEQARKDKVLLDTFSNIDDISTTRDDKIAAIESSINLTTKRNKKINEDLQKRRASAEKEELSGKAPNKDLLKDIDSLKRQINNNKQYITDKKDEIESIKATYAADMERFEKLRTGEIKMGSLQ